jgi:hypothetical protein
MKNRKLAFVLAFILAVPFSNAQINQPYWVYQSGVLTEVKGQIDGKVIVKDKDAGKAINAAIKILDGQKGGELRIASGLYMLSSPVYLRSYVKMTGSGESTVLKPREDFQGEALVMAQVLDHCTVSDLTLQGLQDQKGKSGIIYEDVAFGRIEGVYSRDFTSYGIWLRTNSSMCEVNSCMTSGNDSAGVFLSWCYWAGRAGDAVTNLITNCKSYGEDGNAFELWRSICNNLVGNVVYQCKGHAFYLHEQACSNVITGCRAFSGYKNAVYCNWAHETNITGNIFCWNKGHGIEFENVVWGTISGNNIIDNGGVVDYEKEGWQTGKSYGIYMHSDTKSIQVTGNALFNWGDGHAPMIDGIYEAEDCKFNNITNNNVQFYTGVPANVNGENSFQENNMGNPHFYTETWLGRFRPEKPAPVQVTEPINRDRVDALMDKTRR